MTREYREFTREEKIKAVKMVLVDKKRKWKLKELTNLRQKIYVIKKGIEILTVYSF